MQAVAVRTQSTELEAQRLELLRGYNPHDHLATWTAFDKRTNRTQTVIYYPAAWRLYELSLRYPNANFSSDIIHMDAEKDFVIVRARLYLGNDYNVSEKRAEAHKQGRLTELDRVETKAKARAARDFGIGTEHALDMDDLESAIIQQVSPVNSVNIVEAETPRLPAPKVSHNGHPVERIVEHQSDIKNGVAPVQPQTEVLQNGTDLKARVTSAYRRAGKLNLFESVPSDLAATQANFYKLVSELVGANVTASGQITASRLELIEAYVNSKDSPVSVGASN